MAGRTRLVAGVFAVAVTLAVSLASGADAFVYWDNNRSETPTIIGRANLDGSGANLGFIPGGENPCGVAVNAQYIYWAVGTGTTIARAKLDGSEENYFFITGVSNACGVAVDGQHIYWANGGQYSGVHAGSTIGRANLDGTAVNQSFITGADNPDALAVDGTYVYWANRAPEYAGNATIGRAKLDGTSVNESFITGASSPCGIAVDSAHVYWTNQPVVLVQVGGGQGFKYETNTIGRANLDGSNPNQSFVTGDPGVPNPPTLCGLAVDSAHLYWTVEEPFGAFVPSIGRANLDGSAANESFISTPGWGARGLAVDSLVPSATQLTPSRGSIVFGQSMSFTATVARGNPPEGSSAPTGSVSFTVTGEPSVQMPLDGNDHSNFAPEYDLNVGDAVAAHYAGDAAYGGSSVSLTPTIQPAHTITSLTASPNPQTSSGEVTFTATVTNSSTEIVPFGSVQFVIDGEPVLSPQPLENNGQVGITGAGLPPGEYSVTALYHDGTGAIPDFMDSQSTLTEHITSPPPSPPALASTALAPHITLKPASLNTAFRTLRASARPDGTLDLNELAPDTGTFTAVATTTSSRLRAATANRTAKCRKRPGRCHTATRPTIYGTASATARTPGEVRLVIKPTATARKILSTGRTLHVTVTITFRSAHGGAPATQTTSLVVKRHKARRR